MAISAKAVKELREKTGAGMMDCKKALSEADGDLDKAVEKLRERGLAKAVKRAGRETSEGAIAIAIDGARAGIVELGCETDFVAKTPDFQGLAESLAQTVCAEPGIGTPEELLDASQDGEKVSEVISAAVAKMGENIVPKRVGRLEVPGSGLAGGYVHAGGKLGVVVGLATGATGDAAEAFLKDLAMHVAAHDPSPLSVDRDGVPSDAIDRERELFRRQAEQEGKPEKVIEKIVDGRVNKYYSEVCLLEQAFVKDPDKKIKDLLAEAAAVLGGGEVKITEFVRFKLGEAAGS